MTSKIDVFVSYKQEERALMRKVVDGLHKAGYSAVADINIARNEEFGDAIDQMIRTARLTLTLWTEKSSESEWVRNESRKALALEKAGENTQWLGVLVDDVSLALPPDLSGKQMLNLAADGGMTDAGLERLLAEVAALLGTEEQLSEDEARDTSKDITGELTLFEAARNLDEPEAWQLYLDTYPMGAFAATAREELPRSRQRWRRPFRRSNLGFTFGWLGAAVGVAGLGATVFGMTQGDDPTPVVIGVPEDTHQSVLVEREQLQQDLSAAQTAAITAEDARRTLASETDRLRDLLATTEAELAEAQRNGVVGGETEAAIQSLATELERAEEAEANAIPANLQCNDETGADGVLFLETCVPLTTTSLGVYGPGGDGADRTAIDIVFLDRSQVSDITPLEHLTELGELLLSSTNVTDISPLSGLTDLQTLFLNGTNVIDISPLTGMTNLQELDLAFTNVTDLSPLSGMTNMQRLFLWDTNVDDLSPLEGLSSLTTLWTPDVRSHEGRAAVARAISAWSP